MQFVPFPIQQFIILEINDIPRSILSLSLSTICTTYLFQVRGPQTTATTKLDSIYPTAGQQGGNSPTLKHGDSLDMFQNSQKPTRRRLD